VRCGALRRHLHTVYSLTAPWRALQDKDIKLTVQDNLYKWTAYLQGPEGTPFEGGCFQVLLDVQVSNVCVRLSVYPGSGFDSGIASGPVIYIFTHTYTHRYTHTYIHTSIQYAR